jgi:hypothetical protein
MNRLAATVFLVALTGAGCAPKALRMPGPVRVVGRAPVPEAPVGVRPTAPEPRPPKGAPKPPRAAPGRGDVAVADAARHYLRSPLPRGARDDCSGFVCAALARTGRPTHGNTASLYARADAAGALHRRKLPEVGDLAFFDDTYDRNRNRKADDDLTHIAVVLEVADDGTILLAHAGTSKGRTELRMNLRRPHDHTDEAGQVINDYLRARASSDPPGLRYLAGELWRAFAPAAAVADP